MRLIMFIHRKSSKTQRKKHIYIKEIESQERTQYPNMESLKINSSLGFSMFQWLPEPATKHSIECIYIFFSKEYEQNVNQRVKLTDTLPTLFSN